ncbi:hypothetical protein AVEN_38113-1 [Araneus ventricosus]|uniref:Uncharacterized protein n=1 Tax=Araneus ventricosus TaxID=182803 RepID=A0A4Y2LJH1_ARAVE|nr:hypothetical protein AVEN_38113-1 [Araneus ventricosus]
MGYVKSLVYEIPVNSAEDLVARIAAAAGDVRDTPGIFANVRSSMRRRCEACITARGRNFEHLLDDDRCTLMFFFRFFAVLRIINMFSPLIRALPFLCFVSSLLRQESVSDHALLCDFPSSR